MKSAISGKGSLPLFSALIGYLQSAIRVVQKCDTSQKNLAQGQQVLRRLESKHVNSPRATIRRQRSRRTRHAWEQLSFWWGNGLRRFHLRNSQKGFQVTRRSRFANCVLLTVVVLAVAASAQAATARWSTAQASAKLHGKCAGVGTGVGSPKKYAAFKCQVGSRTVWAKVRPDGAKLCVSTTSLAAVPAYCMVVPGQG